MVQLTHNQTEKQFLLDRGVPLFSGALVGRDEHGDYVICNYAPMTAEQREQINLARFVIVREWIWAHGMFTGDQYYHLRDISSESSP